MRRGSAAVSDQRSVISGQPSGPAVRGASHCPAPLPPCASAPLPTRVSAPLLSPRGSRLRVPNPKGRRRGFTLIEILIVISIIGILITMAQPSFHRAVTAAREATLKENLFVLRDVIDQFYADNGKYPAALADLVEKGYIRRMPKDPVTGSAETWVLVQATDEQGQQAGIYDVKSGSETTAYDGTKYSDW